MEDKWKQKFRDKFAEYEPAIPIPEMMLTPVRRTRKGRIPGVVALTAAAVAVVFAMIIRPDHSDNQFHQYAIPEMRAEVLTGSIPQIVRPLMPFSDRSNGNEEIVQEDSTDSVDDTAQVNVINHTGNQEQEEQQNSNNDYKSHITEDVSDASLLFDGFELAMATRKRLTEFQIEGSGSYSKATRSYLTSGSVSELGSDTLMAFTFPLRVGAALRFSVSARLSLEIGLNYWLYTIEYRLPSHSGVFIDSVLNKSDTRLYFIAIPLNMDYSLYQIKRVELYASLGCEVSYMIKGHEMVDGNNYGFSLKEHRFWYSLTASAGADYRITPRLGLFMEPGVLYRFNTGSRGNGYHEIYSPFELGLSAGIRFRLN